MRREELLGREYRYYREFESSSVRFRQLVQLIKRLIDDMYRDNLLYRWRFGKTELSEILVKSIYLCEIEEIRKYHKHVDKYSNELLNDEQLIEKLLQKEDLSRSLLAHTAFLIEHPDEYKLDQMDRRSDYRVYQNMELNRMLDANWQLFSKLLEDRKQINLIIKVEVYERYHLLFDADGHVFREIPFNKLLQSPHK